MQWNTVFLLLTTILCSALAEHTRVKRRMYAMCPPSFRRIGSECYYISSARLNWLDAHFECKDKNSKLAEPGKSADRKLRLYLMSIDTDPDELWIGGAYDWNSYKWHWGYNGKEITYQSFSQMDPGSSQDLRYHCAVLNPSIKYRWSARSCVDRHRFICQHKMPKVSEKNRVKVYNRWNETYPNQLANEVLLEILDSGENGTRRRTIVKIDNTTYAVDCKIRRVTHRRVKAVGSTDTFTIPVKRRPNAIRRRRKRPQIEQSATEGYQDTEPYSIRNVYTNEVAVSNGHLGTHDIKDHVAQFAPDTRNYFQPIPTREYEASTPVSVRPRGRGRQRQSRPLNDPSVETNETVERPKPNKPRQRTEFDREIEMKRRRELQRRKKQEQHKKWKQEQREKAKREKEEQERIKLLEEEEKLRQATEREAEERRRIEKQREEKRKQMEELEALKQQQLEELERERHQAEQARKRRQEIEKQQKQANEREEQLEIERLEKERQDEEQKRLEEQEERLTRQREYQEELEKKRKQKEHRDILEYEENKDNERVRLEEERRRLVEEEEEKRKRKEKEEALRRKENKREEEELARIEEEARLREEKQKAREEEIRRREELLRQQEEEEKRLQEEIKQREEADRRAREEEELRKEEERKQKEEQARRKQAEQEEKRRQKELRRQKAESDSRAAEEEDKKMKLQKLRERLAKLSPEDQKKFFEMRQQRKKKRLTDDSENESIIPE